MKELGLVPPRADEPGLALAVIRNGQVIARHCAGLADLAHGVPIRPDTRFHIVSVSKTFMAAAVLRLELPLDEDVRRYLPELPVAGVTLRHLLSLTSGLRDVLEIERLRGVWHASASRAQDLLDLALAQREVSAPPGSQYMYTNVNHVLLEAILARASGGAPERFRRRALYEPLGLTATASRPHDGIVTPNLAQPYVAHGGGWVRSNDLLGIAADTLVSSLDDLTRWVLALRSDALAITAAMATPTRLNDGRPIHYGLGLAVRRYRGLTVWCHTGSQPGYKAHIAFVPARDFAVVLLSNREDTAPSGTAARIMDAVLGEDFPAPPPRSVPPPDPALTGAYVDPASGEWAALSIDGDALKVEMLGDTGFLYRGAADVYRDGDDYRATVPMSFDGLTLDVGGRKSQLVRATGDAGPLADFVGVYANAEIGSRHQVTLGPAGLVIHYGSGFDRGLCFPMQPLAPGLFLVEPKAPGIHYRHVFRFERDGAAVVTMERLKGVRLLRQDLRRA